MEPLAATVAETTKLTRLSKSKVYLLIASGELEKVKVGARTLITTKSIHRLLEAA